MSGDTNDITVTEVEVAELGNAMAKDFESESHLQSSWMISSTEDAVSTARDR